MKDEELQQILRELEERIEGMEIDLTPPEESTSNFTVYENAAGDRQMIVHFVDVKDYSIELPTNKEEARSAFLKVIKEHKEHQQRAIAHGDLMVLNCQPCNYYCYVAKVDKFSGTGFQEEDKLDPPAAITDLRGERILHELIIWTETYPNEGGSAVLSSSVISVESGDTNSFKVTEFSVSVEECPEEPVIPDMWDVLLEYFIGDEVEHLGLYYRAQNDNDASPPGEGLGGLTPDWVQIPEDDLEKEEKCPEEQEFSIPKIKITDSSDGETDANFKSRSLEVKITPGTTKDIDIYKPTSIVTDQPCDAIVTTIFPDFYNQEVDYQAGEFIQFNGKYYKAKIPNNADPPDGIDGADNWEEVEEGDLPTDSQDPCKFGTARVHIQKQLSLEGPQTFSSYNLQVSPGNDTPNGAPFEMGTVSVTGGDSGSPKPFTMFDITVSECAPIPPAAWDSNTLYDEPGFVQYDGKFYEFTQVSQGNFPDDPNNSDLWNEVTEEEASEPCGFDETFNFAAPQLKGSYPKSPFNFLTSIALTGSCGEVGSEFYRSFIKSLKLQLGERSVTPGTPVKLLTGLTTKSVTPPEYLDDVGDPVKLLTGLTSLSLEPGSFFNSGSSKDFISSIDSIEIESQSGGTPDGTFEVTVVTEPGTDDTPTRVPVLKKIGEECGCYVLQADGELKLSTKTVKQKTNTYQITNTPSSVKITGSKGTIKPGYTATTGEAVFGTIDAQPKTGSSKIVLEAQQAEYIPMVANQELKLDGKKEMVKYQNHQSQFKVDATTKSATQTDKIYEYKGKQLRISGKEKYLNSSKSTATFQPKVYKIVSSTLTAQLYTRTDTLNLSNGKSITVTPEMTKVFLEYQRMYDLNRASVYLKWDTDQKKLTPEEAELKLSQEYDVTIKNSDIKEIHIEELKKLKLVPKTYTLKKYLHDLEFTAQDLTVNTSNSNLTSTACQTVKVENGGSSTSNFQLQSGTVIPSETPVDETIDTLQMKEVSVGPGASFKASKLEASAISSASEDTKVINGTKLEDGTPPSVPDTLNKTFADVLNTKTYPDEEHEIKGVEITLEPLDDDYVNIESFKLTTTPGSGGGPYTVESTGVTVTDPEQQPEQRMDMLKVEYDDDPSGDLGDVTSTQLAIESGSPIQGEYQNGCISSKVNFDNEADIATETVNLIDQFSACGPVSDTADIDFDLDVNPVEFKNPETGDPVEFTGPNIPGVELTPGLSSVDLATGSGPDVKSIQLLMEGPEEEVTTATVEYEAASSDGGGSQLYIPQLDACPINDKVLSSFKPNNIGARVDCSITDGDELLIGQSILINNFRIKCGVLAEALDETREYLPSIKIGLKPYYEHTLQVCDSDGNRQNITVLTTTAPESASAEAASAEVAGYLIDKNPCPE